MTKIIRTRKNITFKDILKKKKLENAKIAKEKEIAMQAAKNLEFDQFVRATARDILKSSKVQVQVFNTNANTTIPQILSERSVWAPWSKLFKK